MFKKKNSIEQQQVKAVNPMIILIVFLLIAAIATYIIPAGSFDRSLGGRIQVQAAVGVVIETQRIIPLHEVQILPLIQHSECKRTLDRFRHVCKAGKVEGIFLFKELDGHVAIRLDPCFWQVLGAAKNAVVPENAVVCKGERLIFYVAKERVIVSILPRIALCGHTGMAHDGPAVCWDMEPHSVCLYCMELFGENVQIAAASHDLFAKRVNGQIYRPLVEKYIAGEKRL